MPIDIQAARPAAPPILFKTPCPRLPSALLSGLMAAFPHHRLLHQQQQRLLFRGPDGQITLFNPSDQSRPSLFDVMGVAPGDGGSKGWEPRAKRAKEQDFLPMASSHTTAVDFLGTLPVSTGLGLSLDDGRAVAPAAASSSGASPLLFQRLPAIDDEIGRELQRQDAEIDRFVRVQGEQMRQAILQKFQLKQLQTLMSVKDKILHKIQEKEAEVEEINKKNMALEEQMKQLSGEVETWQQWAKYNENMIVSLKFHLQQVLARGRDSREGCGDSEVDDAASFCIGGDANFQLLSKEKKDMKFRLICKFCQVNEVCMLLLPCRHLCLCKECDGKLGFCPLCQSSKFIGMEIYM